MTGLDLSFNKLEGGIPSSLGFLENLRVLWLNNTHIEGNQPCPASTDPGLWTPDFNFKWVYLYELYLLFLISGDI